MIDFSHANSGKDYRRQTVVGHDVAAQIAAGNRNIIGVMIESNLVAGAQKLIARPARSSTARASPTPASTGRKPARCSPNSPPPSAPAAARNNLARKKAGAYLHRPSFSSSFHSL